MSTSASGASVAIFFAKALRFLMYSISIPFSCRNLLGVLTDRLLQLFGELLGVVEPPDTSAVVTVCHRLRMTHGRQQPLDHRSLKP